MGKTTCPGRILTYGLATFHTVFFVLLLVALLFSLGILGNLLAGLNTLAGYVVFGALWGTTWWTTRRSLRGYFKGLNQDAEEGWIEAVWKGKFQMSRVIVRGIVWGAVNGFLFTIALAVLFLIYVSLETIVALLGGYTYPGASITLILITLIASPLGAVVGGVVGFILGIVDGAVLGLVRRLLVNQG